MKLFAEDKFGLSSGNPTVVLSKAAPDLPSLFKRRLQMNWSITAIRSS